MKKMITAISLAVVSCIFIIGCSSSSNSNGVYLLKPSGDMTGEVNNYLITDLEAGEYKIEFKFKEYEYGTLKEESTIFTSIIERDDSNEELKISIVDEESYSTFKIEINESEYRGCSVKLLEDSFYDTGVAMSVLEEDKQLKLDEEVAIAAYSIGGKNNTTEGLNLDGELELRNNLTDLVVYIELNKIN